MRREKGRFELKFLIDFAQKDQILKSCKGLLDLDPNSQNGAYRVTSQYYDTPDLKAYHEKLDGVRLRSKYRLRFYGRYPQAQNFFMEIKHREDRIIRKERVGLQSEYARSVLSNRESLRNLRKNLLGETSRTAERLELQAYRSKLKPTAVVTYLREAWQGRMEPGLRLTFDQFCCGLPQGCFHPGVRSRPLHPQQQIIMELKFNRVVPNWLNQRISLASAAPIRFSKYAEAVDAVVLQGAGI